MRYVTLRNLKHGDINARDILTYDHRFLLSKGEIITERKIQRLSAMGYNGIFITDEISKDLEIPEVVSDNLRVKAVETVRTFFDDVLFERTKDQAKKLWDIRSIVNGMVTDILENNEVVVDLVSLKQFDNYTFTHSVNVAILAIVIGTSMNLNQYMLTELGLAAILHDIGKIFVDKSILNKPDSLTPNEYDHIKKHPEFGWVYLKKDSMFSFDVEQGVLMHHERYNGTGYPNGVAGEDISLYARIIAVADVYDAMTSDRPYKTSVLPSDAMKVITDGSGKLFDPMVVKTFAGKVSPYPTGTIVKLSNGEKGIVVENTVNESVWPKVRIIENDKLTDKYIDFMTDTDISIVEMIY